MNFVTKSLTILIFLLPQWESTSAMFFDATGKQETIKSFKAFNGLQIDYMVLLPLGYDSTKDYPAILSFSTYKYNQKKTMAMINEFWEASTLQDYIVVIPFSPIGQNRGWISHPAHHALEAFLKMIKKSYKIEKEKFHLLGFEEGCIPAQTYLMDRLFLSLTTVSSDEWRQFDTDWYNKMARHQIPTLLIYGDQDRSGLNYGLRAKHALEKRGVQVQLVIEEGDRYSLPSARKGQVLTHIAILGSK